MSLVGLRAKNHPQQRTRDDVDDRRTPLVLFALLHDNRRFTIDVAASHANARLPRYCVAPGVPLRCQWAAEGECGVAGCGDCPHGGAGAVGVDGLACSWRGERVWCNPPYSKLEPWVEKAWNAMHFEGAESVTMLLPANRCEQGWWQRHVEPYRDGPPRIGVLLRSKFFAGRPRFEWPAGRIAPPKGDRPPFGLVVLTWDRTTAIPDHKPTADDVQTAYPAQSSLNMIANTLNLHGERRTVGHILGKIEMLLERRADGAR